MLARSAVEPFPPAPLLITPSNNPIDPSAIQISEGPTMPIILRISLDDIAHVSKLYEGRSAATL